MIGRGSKKERSDDGDYRRQCSRPAGLRADPPAAGAASSERRARGGVDHRQCRELESGRGDAARRAAAADGTAVAAGCPELVLARIWNARWVLALRRNTAEPQSE